MIDFSKVLTDPHGEPVTDKDGTTGLTLARACEIALDQPIASDQNEGLAPKLRRGKLLDQIVVSARGEAPVPIELKSEEISLLKERIGHVFTAASVVRQMCLLLDPAADA